MKVVAVVPVKNYLQAKTRLAEAISSDERAALAAEMVTHVLEALASCRAISDVAVIAGNSSVTLPAGVTLIPQDRIGLNLLLEQGREWAIESRADALLVLFADLPLLTCIEIDEMASLCAQPGTVVLAPDRHETGTNAMMVSPPGLAHFAFGPGSFERHMQDYADAGLRVEVYRSLGTSLDVDTPDDLQLLRNGMATLSAEL